ncbi:MAG: hypothetical protein JW844_07815 [Candidatus Omnitrophica bacterium]|nr:hypothetical protein [Candidatus Omnitrophota bacterium]
MGRMKNCKCPACHSPIECDNFEAVGEMVFCSFCDTTLQVTSIKPPRVKVLKGLKGPAGNKEEDEQTDVF